MIKLDDIQVFRCKNQWFYYLFNLFIFLLDIFDFIFVQTTL